LSLGRRISACHRVSLSLSFLALGRVLLQAIESENGIGCVVGQGLQSL
jgi:hypothetical protein